MFTLQPSNMHRNNQTSLPQNPECSPTEKQLLSLLNEAVNDTGPPEASIISLVFMVVGLVDPSYQATNRSKNHLQSYTPTQQPFLCVEILVTGAQANYLNSQTEVAECSDVLRQINIFLYNIIVQLLNQT